MCAGRYICPSYGGPPADPRHEPVWAEGGMCSCRGCAEAKNRWAAERAERLAAAAPASPVRHGLLRTPRSRNDDGAYAAWCLCGDEFPAKNLGAAHEAVFAHAANVVTGSLSLALLLLRTSPEVRTVWPRGGFGSEA